MAEPMQPPYSIDAEQSVLGGICLWNAAIDQIIGIVTEADFYRHEHQLIFRAIVDMHAARKPIDFVTLSNYMRERGLLDEVGGISYLGTITSDCPSVSNVATYAEIVRERSVMRQLIGIGDDIVKAGFHADGRTAAELMELAEQRVFSIRESVKAKVEGQYYSAVIDAVKSRMDHNRRVGSTGVIGLSTGLVDFDRKTSGLGEGDLMILAGRPSMGKTTLAMNIADHVAVSLNKPAVVFTMEMSAEQIGFRSLSNYARIPLHQLRAGDLEGYQWDELTRAEGLLRDAPLIIDESGGLSPMELRAKARKYARKFERQGGLALIVVDYIQLMNIPGSRENRTNQISEISRSLKALAKELKLPIIALSQLNRGVEQRDNKRPRMADLRESGGIEQDADLVVFVYRDEVYNKDSTEAGTAELLIEKQRNGALGMVRAHFAGEYCRFSNLDRDWAPVQSQEPTDPSQKTPKRGYAASTKKIVQPAYGEVD